MQDLKFTTEVWERNRHNNQYDIELFSEGQRDAFDKFKQQAGSKAQSGCADYPDYLVQLFTHDMETGDIKLHDIFYIDEDIF